MVTNGMEVVGWIGSALFALCAVPQSYHSWKHKSSDGITWAFLLMWLWGEILTFSYVLTKPNVMPLLANYVVNFMLLLVIIWYKKFPGQININPPQDKK